MTQRQINEVCNAFLDAFGRIVEGKDDDDLVFIDGALRSIAEHLGIDATWDEIEPVTVAEFKRRWREGKAAVARGEAPESGDYGPQKEPT